MTTIEPDNRMSLEYLSGRVDYLTGRVEGMEAQLQDLRTGQQDIRDDLRDVREEIRDTRLEIRDTRTGQRQLVFANWVFTATIMAAVIGGMITLFVWLG